MQSRPIRVLLIDDDEDEYEIVCDVLKQVPETRYEVDWARTFDEGLEGVRKDEHDVYLVDYRLGVRTGLDILREGREWGNHSPKIFLTRWGNREIDIEAMSLGATDYLLKDDIRPEIIERTVRYALSHQATINALRDSDERYARAVAGSKDGIWDWDLVTGSLYLSDRWKTMLGYECDEIEDSPEEWFERVHPEDIDRVMMDIATHLEGVTPAFETEHRVLHKNGSYRWMLVRGIGENRNSGRADRMAGSLSDITDRKAAYEILISHISHELRTPLASIQEFASIVKDGIAGPVTSEQDECLETILRSSGQLRKMISDLMEVTRAHSGKLKIEPKSLDLSGLIADVVHSFEPSLARRKLSIEYVPPESSCPRPHENCVADPEGKMPLVYADPERVVQILSNLIENAAKFSPGGGEIAICAGFDPNDPQSVRVSVRDTGMGMSDDVKRHVFDRLFQGSEQSAQSRKGLGLGLYICRELVSLLGGRIWVESEEGDGSTFTFTLPVYSLVNILYPVVSGGGVLREVIEVIRVRFPDGVSGPVLRERGVVFQEPRFEGRAVALPPRFCTSGDSVYLVAAGSGKECDEVVEEIGAVIEEKIPGSGAEVVRIPLDVRTGRRSGLTALNLDEVTGAIRGAIVNQEGEGAIHGEEENSDHRRRRGAAESLEPQAQGQ